MVTLLPTLLSICRNVALRQIILPLFLSLAGLSWLGGKDVTVNARSLSYRPPIPDTHPASNSHYSYKNNNEITSTQADDYDLKSFLLSELRNSHSSVNKKYLYGSRSQIHKRQTSDRELIEQLLKILQRLQSQREENPALTMSSLRFR